jgi:hypothetical protein
MSDVFLIGLVLGLRFLVPLTILRFPLPGMVAAILCDGIDGAILRGYTSFDVELYQHFDKAFDAYYLVIAYVAMLRNWAEPTAITIGRWLFYFRLIGVALFATSGLRPLLFMFPAMFEFYFLGVEVHRTRWRASRLTTSHLVAIASAAWVFKLPQEYWLHIAQRSTTDWFKESVFGMDPSVSRLEVVATHPWIIPAVAAIVSVVVVAGRVALRYLPPSDHPATYDADRLAGRSSVIEGQRRSTEGVISPQLVDKVALVSLVGIAYAEILPDVHANAVQLAFGVGALVIASAVMSERLARNDVRWRSPTAEFATLCAVNAPMMFALVMLNRFIPVSASVGLTAALGYVAIVSMVIAVYDRSRDIAT